MPSESTDKSTEQETKNDGAKPRRLHFPLPLAVALLGVLAVLGVCWMLYQHQAAIRQEYLMERNFRYLAGRVENLGQVIARYEKMFQSILQARSLSKEQADDNGVLECGPGSQPKTVEKSKTVEKRLVERFCDLPHMMRVTIKQEQTDVPPFQASFIGNDVQLEYRYDSRKDSSPVSMHNRQSWLITAQVDLAGIMKPLPVEPIFGDLLLTDSQGNVVHQRRVARHTPEYRFANIATLLKEAHRKQGDKDREPIVPPIFEPFSKGDTEYLIFGQAGRWQFGQATAKKDFDFLAVGILPSHDFYVQAKTIPTSYLLVTIGLILMGALSLPYLRLQSMRSNDALSQGDVFALLYCTVLWVGAATFLVVILAAFLSTREKFDERLKEAASKINDNFVRDVQNAKEQLKQFDDLLDGLLSAQCKQECVKDGRLEEENPWSEQLVIVPDGRDQENHVVKLKNTAGGLKLKNPDNLPQAKLRFYDLSKVLWVDEEGRKRVDWSWKRSERQLPLREREYIKQIRSGAPFWIESIYSWTTGKNFAMVSKKSNVSPDGESPFVVALQGQFPSVMDAVVQPGMGFAVIDQEGKVQFHSDSHRNLREDFFAETDDNEQLRAAVWTGKSASFPGQYWGKDRRFYVTPLKWERSTNPGTTTGQEFQQGGQETQEAKGTPKWSLVVYLNQDVLEAPLLEAGFFAVALFVLYALVILGVGLFWLLIKRLLESKRGGPIWPREVDSGKYALVSILNVALLVLYGLTTFLLMPALQNKLSLLEDLRALTSLLPLFVIFLLPALLIVVILYLAGPTESSSRFSEWLVRRVPNKYRFRYLLMSVSSLLLFAMLPAFDFFTMAYKEEMRLYAAFSQYDYKKDLEEGRQRVTNYYKGLFDASKGNAGQASKLREDFIAERTKKLEESSVKTFLFSSAEQPTLSSHLPMYATVRHLFTTQFGTETGRFLEKGPDPEGSEPAGSALPAVRWYLYCGLIVFGLLPCILWWKLDRRPDQTSDSQEATVPKDISIRLFVLVVLSIGLFVVLIWPWKGFLLMSALVFAGVSYGLPSMVAGQVFFLWEPHKDGVSQGEIQAQWGKCSRSEKLTLFHLAEDLFFIGKADDLFFIGENEGLTGLKSKGLVQFEPNLQLIKGKDSKDDRAFIKQMFKEDKDLQQSREEPVNLGEQAIWTMKVGLFGLASFILYTQEEFRPAVLAALAPALPTLLRLPLGLDPSKLLDLLTPRKKG